jgi:hypothetical protein
MQDRIDALERRDRGVAKLVVYVNRKRCRLAYICGYRALSMSPATVRVDDAGLNRDMKRAAHGEPTGYACHSIAWSRAHGDGDAAATQCPLCVG